MITSSFPMVPVLLTVFLAAYVLMAWAMTRGAHCYPRPFTRLERVAYVVANKGKVKYGLDPIYRVADSESRSLLGCLLVRHDFYAELTLFGVPLYVW